MKELNRLWDRFNVKYEKAQDEGNTKEVNRLYKQMRELVEQIEG